MEARCQLFAVFFCALGCSLPPGDRAATRTCPAWSVAPCHRYRPTWSKSGIVQFPKVCPERLAHKLGPAEKGGLRDGGLRPRCEEHEQDEYCSKWCAKQNLSSIVRRLAKLPDQVPLPPCGGKLGTRYRQLHTSARLNHTNIGEDSCRMAQCKTAALLAVSQI